MGKVYFAAKGWEAGIQAGAVAARPVLSTALSCWLLSASSPLTRPPSIIAGDMETSRCPLNWAASDLSSIASQTLRPTSAFHAGRRDPEMFGG